MASEKYANAALTTLNGAINSATTSVVVTSASLFPTSGQFRILIDNEIMLVTAVAANTFTVTRGAEGTAANSHGNSVAVYGVLTAGAVDQIRQDICGSNTWANRPASEKAGKLYLPTDGFMVSRDDGSAWHSWGPTFPFTEVNDASFSWVNQGSSTKVTTQGGVYLSNPASNTHALAARVIAVPATPYSITAMMLGFWDGPLVGGNVQCLCGLCLRDSVSGKVLGFGWGGDATYANFGFSFIAAAKFNSPTSFNSYYRATFEPGRPSPTRFLKIRDDGATRTLSISADGQNFIQFHTIANTDFLTPNQIGFFCTNNNNLQTVLTVLSWAQGT